MLLGFLWYIFSIQVESFWFFIFQEKRIAKNMRNVPDDEGWITVTRKGFF